MGATVNLHYCMNTFVGWSLFHSKDDKCGKCGMEEKDYGDCCKDEYKHFKLKADHQKAGAAAFITNIVAPVVITTGIFFNFQLHLMVIESYSSCHAPPDIGDTKLHVLHCLFLI